MAVFPTLSKAPAFPLDPDGELEDAILRSPMEAGYEQSRPKFTRARRTYGLRYRLMASDLAALRDFETVTLRNGADSFTWTHPIAGTTHAVRLTAPIKYAYSNRGLTDVSFAIREV